LVGANLYVGTSTQKDGNISPVFELGRQVERRFTDAVRRVDVHLRQKLFQIAARAALRRLVQNPVASPLVVDVSAAEEAQQPDPSIHVIHGRAAAAPAAVLDHLVIDAVLLLHIQGGQDEVVEARVLGHVAHERQRQLDPRLVVARRVTVRVLVVANYRQSTILNQECLSNVGRLTSTTLT